MEVAHLSDQIPRYWRPWLESNKGKGNPDEVNRLAERIVAFYVSQIGEDDLPLIENNEAVVGTSREVLRGCGNMSSATLMFVLERIMQHDAPPHKGMALAFGPGVAVEGFLYSQAGT